MNSYKNKGFQQKSFQQPTIPLPHLSFAETLQRFGQKGRRFLIETHVQTGSYDAKDGHKVYTYDFVIDRFEFADSKTTEEKPIDSGFMDIPDGVDEELPF